MCHTLQHTLHHTATHIIVPSLPATHCNTLQDTATHCHTLQHTATHCYYHLARLQRQHTCAHRRRPVFVWEHKRGGGRKYSNKKRREMKRTREPYFSKLQQYSLLSAVLGHNSTYHRYLLQKSILKEMLFCKRITRNVILPIQQREYSREKTNGN